MSSDTTLIKCNFIEQLYVTKLEIYTLLFVALHMRAYSNRKRVVVTEITEE